MSRKTGNAQFIDPMENFLGYQMRRASAAAMADLGNALGVAGLSPTLAGVLLMIDANPGETQAWIGRALAIKRANIAPIIARLEENGLIARKNSKGRSIGLACTQRGNSAAKRAKTIMKEHETRIFGAINSMDQTKLILIFEGVRRRIKDAS